MDKYILKKIFKYKDRELRDKCLQAIETKKFGSLSSFNNYIEYFIQEMEKSKNIQSALREIGWFGVTEETYYLFLSAPEYWRFKEFYEKYKGD